MCPCQDVPLTLRLPLNTFPQGKAGETSGAYSREKEAGAQGGNTVGRAIHTSQALSPYLAHVLHDETVLADLLQRGHPSHVHHPAEDAEVSDALLYHSVGAVIATAAAGVALVDGQPGSQAHLALVIVGNLCSDAPGQQPQPVPTDSPGYSAAHSHLVEGDAPHQHGTR